MGNEIFEALRLLEKERGISMDFMLEKINKAIVTACKNSYDGNEHVEVLMDEKTGLFEVDLYKEINSVQDWKDINTSPTENYMLMTDLDFINEGSTIRITNTYTGKLNGNQHTIKNIVLDSKFLFSNMNGTLEKLYVENLKYAGLIDNSSGGIMNEIHLKDVLYEADKISSRQVWSIGRSSYK